jgi:hypothetical protein
MTRTACPRAHGSADAKIKSYERQLRNPQDRRAINAPFTQAMSGQFRSRAVTQVGRSDPMTDFVSASLQARGY